MTELEKTPDKLFYTIGEVSRMLDEPVPTLRYWVENYVGFRPRTNKKGNRLFTPSDIKKLKSLKYLVREKKMTLKGAFESLKKNPENIDRNTELFERLNSIKTKMQELQQFLSEKGKDSHSHT